MPFPWLSRRWQWAWNHTPFKLFDILVAVVPGLATLFVTEGETIGIVVAAVVTVAISAAVHLAVRDQGGQLPSGHVG